jgi:hypothetical protein
MSPTSRPDELSPRWFRQFAQRVPLPLKCFQRLGRFAKAREVLPGVVEHVRRCLELKEDVAPAYASARTAESHRGTGAAPGGSGDSGHGKLAMAAVSGGDIVPQLIVPGLTGRTHHEFVSDQAQSTCPRCLATAGQDMAAAHRTIDTPRSGPDSCWPEESFAAAAWTPGALFAIYPRSALSPMVVRRARSHMHTQGRELCANAVDRQELKKTAGLSGRWRRHSRSDPSAPRHWLPAAITRGAGDGDLSGPPLGA